MYDFIKFAPSFRAYFHDFVVPVFPKNQGTRGHPYYPRVVAKFLAKRLLHVLKYFLNFLCKKLGGKF